MKLGMNAGNHQKPHTTVLGSYSGDHEEHYRLRYIPYNAVNVFQSFGGKYCLNLQFEIIVQVTGKNQVEALVASLLHSSKILLYNVWGYSITSDHQLYAFRH
jgi:hypothetical protein